TTSCTARSSSRSSWPTARVTGARRSSVAVFLAITESIPRATDNPARPPSGHGRVLGHRPAVLRLLPPAVPLPHELLRLPAIEALAPAPQHPQPLRVLGVVLAGQRVPDDPRYLVQPAPRAERLRHLFRGIAVGQHQHMSHIAHHVIFRYGRSARRRGRRR